MVGIIIKVIGIVLAGGVVVVGVGAALTFTGSPKPCVDRAVPVSVPASQAENKWNGFKLAARSGSATVTFYEEEVTSFVDGFVRDEGLPAANVQVYFCPQGYAEATAEYVGGGPSINLLARGTLSTTGNTAQIDIQSIRGGNMPSFIPVANLATRFTEAYQQLNLDITITSVTITDGQVRIEGRP